MTTLAKSIVSPFGLTQEQTLSPPQHSPRAYRRPGPPPSQKAKADRDRRALPMCGPSSAAAAPSPAALPRETPAGFCPGSAKEPLQRYQPRHISAVVDAAVFALASGLLLFGLMYFSSFVSPTWMTNNRAAAAARDTDDSSEANARPDTRRPTAEASVTPSESSAAEFLSARFYDLQYDSRGHVIRARMPVDEDRRRFGPRQEEVDALAELPKLRELDLRDTIASVAVPIANRNPAVEVLVLEQQADAASLRNLRHVRRLHLRDSHIDKADVSGTDLMVVKLD